MFRLRSSVIAILAALPALPAAAQSSDADVTVMEQVSVTATREQGRVVETPVSVGSVSGATIAADRPTHPAQVMGQMPGVGVAVTNGEGHTTAIRQPFTTAPMYLFLEDGIPSRSTGFFNHNGLYEINIPQSGGIEVLRGPATALYGSDAIGGIVNVLTRTPPDKREIYASGEVGEHGWWRTLLGGGTSSGADAWRADLNLTHTDGWRDRTKYDRQSGTARWDRAIGNDASLKTVLGFSRVDQQTGANSPLVAADYQNNPTRNYLPIAYRKVEALRLSTNYEREFGNSLLSLTPYVRDNSMDLLASFRLRFDPTIAQTENRSYGLLAKWRTDFAPMRARLIAGVDFDYSPGSREEDRLNVVTRGAGATREFLAYSIAGRIYDYEVTFRGISPYLQGEISPTDRLRLTLGARYDRLKYKFDNRLAPAAVAAGGTFYGQAADTSIDFENVSPKLGATFALTPNTHLFGSYNYGFRAPSEGDLFRPSSAGNAAAAQIAASSALGLAPIQAEQAELGIRGRLAGASYDLTVYNLEKRNDLVSFTDRTVAGNPSRTVNAGKTRHQGVELGVGLPLARQLRFDVAASYAKHEYVEWQAPGVNLSGREIASAPRVLANTRLTWTPMAGARAQLEWVRIGPYWMDEQNTTKYGGHHLLNLRGNVPVSKNVTLFGNVWNLADKRHADSASTQTVAGAVVPMFSPGLPRTAYAGVEVKW